MGSIYLIRMKKKNGKDSQIKKTFYMTVVWVLDIPPSYSIQRTARLKIKKKRMISKDTWYFSHQKFITGFAIHWSRFKCKALHSLTRTGTKNQNKERKTFQYERSIWWEKSVRIQDLKEKRKNKWREKIGGRKQNNEKILR